MKKTFFARFIIIALAVLIVGIIIAAIFSLGSALFGGGSSKTNNQDDVLLLSNTSDARVEVLVRGPIVADEDFKSQTITISQNKRTLYIYKGYKNEVKEKVELSNSVKAYGEFINALGKAGFMTGKPQERPISLEGICATGKVYEFSLYKGDTEEQTVWTSTCNGSIGNLNANLSQVYSLFLRQIPDSERSGLGLL